MNVVRWNPISEMTSLRDAMDRLFEQSFVRPRMWTYTEGYHFLPIDMYQTDESVVIEAQVPGMRSEDIDVTFEDGVVTIKGHTEAREDAEPEHYFYHERAYGSFCRQVTLPYAVSVEKADATFDNGVLKLMLPKAEEAKPKQIKVHAPASLEAPKKETGKKK